MAVGSTVGCTNARASWIGGGASLSAPVSLRQVRTLSPARAKQITPSCSTLDIFQRFQKPKGPVPVLLSGVLRTAASAGSTVSIHAWKEEGRITPAVGTPMVGSSGHSAARRRTAL
tara:strand:- start:465 stop:812 length:348 start_codon:yes stop_codon:yes gene_type:complete